MELDYRIFFWVNHGLGKPQFDTFFVLISDQNFWGVVALIGFCIGLYFNKVKTFQFLWRSLLALAIVDWVSFRIFKFYFERLRPCYEFEFLVRLVRDRCGSDFGFPSNHAANGFALVAAAWLAGMGGKAVSVIAFIAMWIGFSRIYLGVHYAGDVLFGFVEGFLLAAAAIKVVEYSLKKMSLKGRVEA